MALGNRVSPLTVKQERFVREYISNGRNASAAYRISYSPGASSQRAAEEGHRLLKHPKIAPRLASVLAKAEKVTEVTAARVLRELARVAFSDIRTAVNWDDKNNATVTPSACLTPDQAAAISEITISAKGELCLKLHAKNKALATLAETMGLRGQDSLSRRTQPDPAAHARRSEMRAKLHAMLADLAKPEPLINHNDLASRNVTGAKPRG